MPGLLRRVPLPVSVAQRRICCLSISSKYEANGLASVEEFFLVAGCCEQDFDAHDDQRAEAFAVAVSSI